MRVPRPFVLIVSIGLNLALAAAVFVVSQRTSETAAGTDQMYSAPVTHVIPAPPSHLDSTPSSPPPAILGFHWRELESADYIEYVANLRAVGCPERIVRDIVVADIHKLYEERIAALRPAGVEPWRNMEHRRQNKQALEKSRHALRMEKLALLELLFGPDGPTLDPHMAAMANDDDLGVFLGFLDENKSRALLAILMNGTQEWQATVKEAGDIFIDDHEAAAQRMQKETMDRISLILTPMDLEELRCRIQLDEDAVIGRQGLSLDGVDISGHELRQICLLSLDSNPVIPDRMFVSSQPSPEDRARKLEMFRDQVAALLGPSRSADLHRAQDRDFRTALAFTRENHLPKTVAIEISNARNDTAEALRSLALEQPMSGEERAAALALLRQATERRLLNALGPNAGRLYLDHHASWLNQMNTGNVTP